ncbi:response regulator [Rubripirellula amarantea]|uniref:Response regulator MprA n=1 Tax=Rubripirellula amarantea TaxID=2527999 RepID=A0A5C5WSC5_9BACT|nr:response regulator [Rubripirellula amarantea]MDA8744316.1 response regulator [Rubripirellula amarantea]TWT53824.1 Response regulator MprA [Rubripirellula amarantea]
MPDSIPLKRCLIADDVRASRKVVGSWLHECQFQCEYVEDGRTAWESIVEQPPELLVTDLEMPVLCGLELLFKIRNSEDDRVRRMPVLVMTSLQDNQTWHVIEQMGGDGLLHKPLDKQSTLSMVTEMVTRSRRRCEATLPSDDQFIQGMGVISPTLRRLLRTVTENQQW